MSINILNTNLGKFYNSKFFQQDKNNKLINETLMDSLENVSQHSLIKSGAIRSFNNQGGLAFQNEEYSDSTYKALNDKDYNNVSSFFSLLQSKDIKDSNDESNLEALMVKNIFDNANQGSIPMDFSAFSFNVEDITVFRPFGIHEIPMALLPTLDAIKEAGLIYNGLNMYNKFVRMDFYRSSVIYGDWDISTGVQGAPDLRGEASFQLAKVSLMGTGYSYPTAIEMEYMNAYNTPMLFLKYKDYGLNLKLNHFYENGIVEEGQYGLNTIPSSITLDLSTTFSNNINNLLYGNGGAEFDMALTYIKRVITQRDSNTFLAHDITKVFMPLLWKNWLESEKITITGNGTNTLAGIFPSTVTVANMIEQKLGKIHYAGHINEMIIIRRQENFNFVEGVTFQSGIREMPNYLGTVINPYRSGNMFEQFLALTGLLTSNSNKIIRVILPKLPSQVMNFKPRSNAFTTIGAIIQNGNTNAKKITPAYSNNTMTTVVEEITN